MCCFIDEVYNLLIENEILKKRFSDIILDKNISRAHKHHYLNELLKSVHEDVDLEYLISRGEKEIL